MTPGIQPSREGGPIYSQPTAAAQPSPASILARMLGSIFSNDVRYSPTLTGALNQGLRPSASDMTLRDLQMMGPDQSNNLQSLYGPGAFASMLWSMGLLSPLGMRARRNAVGGVMA